jgi:AbrB family looped-hinge helix DNA binding protein
VIPYLSSKEGGVNPMDGPYKAKVTSKGQVTIPVDLRRKMGLDPGDVLEIRESPQGYILSKYIQDSPFDRYVGYLEEANASTDRVIDEMRGPR